MNRKLDYFLALKKRNRLLAVSQYDKKTTKAICLAQVISLGNKSQGDVR